MADDDTYGDDATYGDDDASGGDNYSPIPIVAQCHNIKHLDPALQEVDNTFYYDVNGTFYNEYTESLVTVPLIILVLGFIATLIVSGVLLYRAYSKNKETGKADQAFVSIQFLVKLLVAGCLLTLLADQTVFFANQSFTAGVKTSRDALNALNTRFSDLHSYGQLLSTIGQDFNTNFAAAVGTCQGIKNESTAIGTLMFHYDFVVTSYVGFMEPIPGNTDEFKSYVDTAESYKDGFVWIVYILVLCTLLAYVACMRYQNKASTQVSLGAAEFLNLFIMFLAFAEMIIVIGLADFCMDPATNLLKFYTENSTTYDALEYYSTCEGTNPADAGIFALQGIIFTLDDTVKKGGEQCTNDTNVDGMKTSILGMYSQIALIDKNAECPPIQKEIALVLEEGVCVGIFRGLYTFWIEHNVTAALLFITTAFFGAVFYYYGVYWDIAKQNQNSDRETDLYLNVEEDGLGARGSMNPVVRSSVELRAGAEGAATQTGSTVTATTGTL
jgi:hypothetical protein